MDFLRDVFDPISRGGNGFNRVFHWLAGSYGSHFPVSSCTILRQFVLCKCFTARAYSSRIRPAHLLDEPSGFWDSYNQEASVGGRIPKKNKTDTKVLHTAVVNLG